MKLITLPLRLKSPIFGTLLALLSPALMAQNNPAPRQDLAELQRIAESFLRNKSIGLPGDVKVTVNPVDARRNLPPCTAPDAFSPNGSRPWGRTTVGIRCTGSATWTIFMTANVQVISEYLVTTSSLGQGQMITERDISRLKGDLAVLPNNVLTDETQAIGRTTTISMNAGTPLRQDALRTQWAVQQGQSVHIVSNGPGFQITVEGHAISNAVEGQSAQVRTPNGQVISGVVRPGGIIEIPY